MKIQSKGAIAMVVFGIGLIMFGYYAFHYKSVNNAIMVIYDILGIYALVFAYYLWTGRKAQEAQREFHDKHYGIHVKLKDSMEQIFTELNSIKLFINNNGNHSSKHT